MTRMMVTGGAGFIGSTLADRLLAAGHDVAVLDNLSSGDFGNLQHATKRQDGHGECQLLELDITSADSAEAIQWYEPAVIFHLAAQIDVRHSVADPVHDAETNLVGTVRILEAAKNAGTRKVVFATSGGCIYGDPDPTQLPINEAAPTAPLSPYGASKHAVETYLQMYQALHGLSWTSLALANVYGPRQRVDGEAGVVAIFASGMLAGRPLTIYGDGQQTRDFVYVDDVVQAFVSAADRGSGQRFNIGTGVQSSVLELFQQLAAQTGYDRPAQFAPAREGEIRFTALDARRANTGLDWVAAYDLPQGLAATLQWLAGAHDPNTSLDGVVGKATR